MAILLPSLHSQQKLAELFCFHRGFPHFYTACCFFELSRVSVLCILNASFGKWFPQRHNSIFYAKIDDHGIRRGDTGQKLTRWRRPVASRVALDLPYWAMRSAPYHTTWSAWPSKWLPKQVHFFVVVNLMSCIITVAKPPCYGEDHTSTIHNLGRSKINANANAQTTKKRGARRIRR
jgi:hypothetical protein